VNARKERVTTEMAISSIDNIIDAIQESEMNGLLAENPVLNGFSGEKLIGLLQRLSNVCLSENECYLEVGVFQGLTLLSVAKAMKVGEAYGIDNFAFFDKKGENYSIVKNRIKSLDIDNAVIINMDYEDALEQLGNHIGEKKVGVYFVDGPHDYRSQLMCLELVKPFLARNAVIIVDDSNYRHVRQANRDFLTINPNFKLIYEAYTGCHPHNMTTKQESEARKGWWNGANVIIKDPDNQLEQMHPPTLRDRSLFENDHIIHGERASLYGPEVLRIASSLLSLNVLRICVNLARFFGKIRKTGFTRKGMYRSMNTYSDDIKGSNYNKSVRKK
jgi:predicted O-methyltransferase YrrM